MDRQQRSLICGMPEDSDDGCVDDLSWYESRWRWMHQCAVEAYYFIMLVYNADVNRDNNMQRPVPENRKLVFQ